ncbi:uncharacterized protein LOC135699510 [Ochlerotatus camptorhynchus]|uniref:uncharacterized protein LOC135699510 n=1 Tax=Ochlerotatus camptorhynchus TaxID=644619 RepID=UPI0031CF4F95
MTAIFERYQRGTSFTNWVERLGYFFEATDVIDPEMQKAYLITLLDSTAFSELKVLCSNKDLKLVTYEEIVQRLQDRYDRKDCGLIQRYKFHNRVQLPNEAVQDFIDAVKLQADLCSFGNFKQTAIVDRIVIGIRDKVLQRRLLCEEELTLASTEKIIATWELTGQSRGQSVKERLGVVRVGRASVGYEDLTKTTKNKRTKDQSNSTCGFCGRLGHARKRCFELKVLTEEGMMDVRAGMRTPKGVIANSTSDDVNEANGSYYWKRVRSVASE